MKSVLQRFFKNILVRIFFVLLLISIGVFWALSSRSESYQVYVVGKHDVEQVVLLSGEVKATNQVELSFGVMGRVSSTTVSQGDLVTKGQVLAELDRDALEADLLQAQGGVRSAESQVSLTEATLQKAEANLALVRAQNRGTDSSIAAAEEALQNTITEQDTLVRNAYLELLNNDLTAYPVDNYKNVPQPVVSGSYTSGDIGEYYIDFYNSGARTGFSTRVSGLWNGTMTFDDHGIPAALGSAGLYLTLPESGEGESYGSTDWVVPIPNNRSVTYQTKLNAYEKARQTRLLAVTKAQSELDTLIAQQESGENIAITTAQEQQAVAAVRESEAHLEQALAALVQAQASVSKIQAQIKDSSIFAPFDGVVARQVFEVGQSVTAGQVGITLITEDNYELEMNIPEIDVAKVSVADEADIILDAYGTDVVWSGVVDAIELVETEIDGVPSYVSTISIQNPDQMIKVGMNARARIVVAEKEAVVAVPTSYVTTKEGVQIVLVQNNDNIEERPVQTGLKGTDYFIEITDGLSEGDTLILPDTLES